MAAEEGDESASVLEPVRQFFAFDRDVLVLSVAMLAFGLSFQMTSRYVPEYLRVLGAGAGVIGLFGSVGNLVSALYPYPGGGVSDRIGSRLALTSFGTVATAGFLLWYVAPLAPAVPLPGVRVTLPILGAVEGGGRLGPWVWIFLGLFLTQAWKSFGLGATFAVVKQSTAPEHLAMGFASTEVFRRIGFLVGPLLAAGVLALTATFVDGFRWVLLVAAGFGAAATVAQHVLYDASEDSIGSAFGGLDRIVADLRALPETLCPLLVADTLVRFANGMVYVFFVIVVVEYLAVGASAFGVTLRPDAFFGVLLGVEMVVALATMVPSAKVAESVGLKPVVALGFAVYAVFPVLLIVSPTNPWALLGLFAFSGLRFAGLPAHKALIVGPAEADAGGRVTGTYYLLRNVVVIPSAALGGWLYGSDWAVSLDVPGAASLTLAAGPTLAFGTASAVGLVGVGYFAVFGREFDAYARAA